MVRRLTYPYRATSRARSYFVTEMPFLELPEALRRRIYEAVLSNGRDAVPLLQTCQQIFREAQPMLFDTPLTFQSQYDLVEWVSTVGAGYAGGVQRLHLTLQDLEVLPASRDSGHLSWPSLSLLELYKSEAEKVVDLLSRLPRLSELSLVKPESVRSYLYSDFYYAVLRRVTADLPYLKAITFHSDEHNLQFIKSLPDLRQLSFTGFSKNSPMETSSILSRMKHLEEVEILTAQTPTVFGGLEIETAMPRTQSFTREVLRDLRGLKSFTLRERKDERTPTPAFCNSRFIQALDSTHRSSLERLVIEVDFVPDAACQKAIRSLCSTSTLKHISITWPGMRGDLLNSLPKSLVTLRTCPSVGRPPYWAMLVLQWKRSELPNLRNLVLVGDSKSSPLSQSATSTQAFKSADAALSVLGVCTHVESLQSRLSTSARSHIRSPSTISRRTA